MIDSAMSRLRPAILAATTTVLGVMPLLQDVFWIGMAVIIIAGLTLGTVLTGMKHMMSPQTESGKASRLSE